MPGATCQAPSLCGWYHRPPCSEISRGSTSPVAACVSS